VKGERNDLQKGSSQSAAEGCAQYEPSLEARPVETCDFQADRRMVPRRAVLSITRSGARATFPLSRAHLDRSDHGVREECVIIQARTLRRIFWEFDPSRPGEKRRLAILSASDRGAEIQEDHDENWEIAELVAGVIRRSGISGNPGNGE
jgi:hypothetical protein